MGKGKSSFEVVPREKERYYAWQRVNFYVYVLEYFNFVEVIFFLDSLDFLFVCVCVCVCVFFLVILYSGCSVTIFEVQHGGFRAKVH